MDLSQLRRLVRQYVDGEIAYAPFRAQFVSDYLAVLSTDWEAERNVNVIEILCADFDEGDISEIELKSDLSHIANHPTVSVQVNTAARSEGASSRAIFIKPEELVA